MMDNMKNNKLTEDELENVAGGLIFNAANVPGYDQYNNWQVIDNNTGAIIKCFHTKGEAVDWTLAQYGGSNPNDIREISLQDISNLRNGIRY